MRWCDKPIFTFSGYWGNPLLRNPGDYGIKIEKSTECGYAISLSAGTRILHNIRTWLFEPRVSSSSISWLGDNLRVAEGSFLALALFYLNNGQMWARLPTESEVGFAAGIGQSRYQSHQINSFWTSDKLHRFGIGRRTGLDRVGQKIHGNELSKIMLENGLNHQKRHVVSQNVTNQRAVSRC